MCNAHGDAVDTAHHAPRTAPASIDSFHMIQRPSARGRGSTEEARGNRGGNEKRPFERAVGAYWALGTGGGEKTGGEWAVVDEGQIAQNLAEQ